MTKTQEQLIHLLGISLSNNSSKCVVSDDCNWLELLEVASSQTVTGQIWYAIENAPTLSASLSIEEKLHWYGNIRAITERKRRVDEVLGALVFSLEKEQIPSLLLKGSACAAFYPKPEYRASGDIDLYVGKESHSQAMECLQKAGLIDKIQHQDIKHTSFSYKGISVELHKQADLLPSHNDEWQSCIASFLGEKRNDCQSIKANGVDVAILPKDLNVVYVFIHMFRHFVGGGIKLRQLCDWVYLRQNIEDDNKVGQYLQNFGYKRVWDEFCKMTDEYFGDGVAPSGRSVAIMEQFFKMVKQSPVSNKGFLKKMTKPFSLYSEYFVAFKLYPKYCLKFLFRLIQSHIAKYVFKK